MKKNDYPFTDPEYLLWLQLSGARIVISKARQLKRGKYIHHNQAASLNIIWALMGKATPGTISKALFLQHHTVSELLSRLEGKGLVRKQRDAQTRNVVRLHITKQGKEYCRKATQADLISRIVSVLDSAEQQQLSGLLHKLADAANREIEQGDGPEKSLGLQA